MSPALRRMCGVSSLFGVLACSLLVETDVIDEGCPANTKFCGGACVSVDDPAYGCTPGDCIPCERDQSSLLIGNRFIPKCENGQCVPDQCPYGYGCDRCGKLLLTDPANCGACNKVCDSGACWLGTCVEGGAGAPSDGR
ncbi:MAG TPA: hypothetical protein VFZ53_14925 [Polyangiaceae bacterium]